MTHVDLFSGIGGFALAARWAGFTTVCFVEIDEYCQKVLQKNFGAVADAEELYGNGRKLHAGSNGKGQGCISEFGNSGPVIHADIRTFDGTKYRRATLLTGGFPCQPFSHAGKRRGKEDDRALWPEMFRVIREVRPAWVVGENVAGLVTMELDSVLSDLEGEGYGVQTFIIPACAVDARHRRDRVWILARNKDGLREDDDNVQPGEGSLRIDSADSESTRIVGHAEHAERRQGEYDRGNIESRHNGAGQAPSEFRESGENVADAEGIGGQQAAERCEQGFAVPELGSEGTGAEWLPEPAMGLLVDGLSAGLVRRGGHAEWPEEPQIPIVASGVKNRVNQLKGLGNAIVPQVAYEILRAIAQKEQE